VRIEAHFFDDSGRHTPHNAAIIAVDMQRDLALLVVKSSKAYPTARLASKETCDAVTVASEVYAVGGKLGMVPTPTEGLVSGRAFEGSRMGKLWGTSACTIFGNSGGGVFLKKTGELIGVMVMVAMVRTELLSDGGAPIRAASVHPVCHMGFFVPLASVREFLAENGCAWITEKK
jgi:S1-C subfamily serine protease